MAYYDGDNYVSKSEVLCGIWLQSCGTWPQITGGLGDN